MRLWKRLRSLLRVILKRSRIESEMDSELQFHIATYAEEAMRRARLEFGGIERAKEACREATSVAFVESLAQDIRFGLRMLRKSPGFTAAAVFTLALGIGANTAVFSMVDAVLLRPFPYPHPDQLVTVFDTPLKQPDALSGMSYRDFVACRAQSRAFSGIAGNAFHDLTLTGAGEPSIVNTADVTPEIFPVLGAQPLVGRTLLPEDGKRGAAPVALVSENLWRGRFGANPRLVGQSITLDMRPFTVVGVLPASFRYPDGGPRQDVWIPIAQDPLFGPLLSRPGVPVLSGIARLKPGISLLQAQAEMSALGKRFAKKFPEQDSGETIRLQPYRQAVVGNVKPALLILLGAVGLVLLIACANIGNLLL